MKIILSILMAIAILTTGTLAQETCECGYMNSASYTENGVTYTLAVDNFYYTTLDSIRFCYSVSNGSQDTVRFDFSTLEHFAFRVYPDSCESFCQDGCLDSSLYYEPNIIHYGQSSIILPPAACTMYRSAWHIGTKVTPGADPKPGSYNVIGGLWDDGFDECLGHLINSTELKVDIIIEGIPVGTEQKSWGAIKSIFSK